MCTIKFIFFFILLFHHCIVYFIIRDGIEEGRDVIRVYDLGGYGVRGHQRILRHHRVDIVDELKIKLKQQICV